MVALKNSFSNLANNFVDSKLSQDGRFGWFLAFWHPEDAALVEEISAFVKLSLRGSDADRISKLEVEDWLKNFFNELHWKLYAQLRKSDLKEKGVSLFFGILYDHELFFVQFGRLFCRFHDGKRFKNIGLNYQDLRIASFEKLNLLGYLDSDIPVKVNRLFIGEEQSFFVVNDRICARLSQNEMDKETLAVYLDSLGVGDDTLWLSLFAKPKLIMPTKKRLNRLQLSTIIIILLTVLATLYMMFGNSFLDQFWHRARLKVQRNRSLRLEQIPDSLSEDMQNLFKYINRIVNMPAREIELGVAWSTTLSYDVTNTPVFSIDNIFLASDNTVLAFDKKNRQLKWNKSFEDEINSLVFSENTLMVFLESGQSFGFKEDGTELWQSELKSNFQLSKGMCPFGISPEDDPRLSRPILVVPSLKAISIVYPGSGETLSAISFKDDIHRLSAYDSFANCFYAIVDDGILCISLRIEN